MKVTIVPIVIGALGTITKGLLKGLGDLEVGGRVETIQTSAKLPNKRCTCVNNRCIRSKISGDNLDCGQVELDADVTPTRSRWVSNNYITRCHRQVERVGDKML